MAVLVNAFFDDKFGCFFIFDDFDLHYNISSVLTVFNVLKSVDFVFS